MEALPWFWIWVVLTAALCVGEMFTGSFFMLPFAVGAAVAAVANALGAPLPIQWVLFIVISLIALFLLRPFAKKVTIETAKKSGVDRLVGSIGVVIRGDAPEGEARARVDREEWNVLTEDGSVPQVNTRVRVMGVDGTHLIVRVEQ
ncbi:MAG: NfeD family protein [Coriobacteriales bacterium]|jgi:membrane protein implicated in regulation of membrane protease activity|nr:NfeD family protein [Coriobacteriales bacterium]